MANQIARKLRKSETVAEKRLWQELRKLRAQGYHFRRQHPIGAYVVDFACLAHRVIIEVDGRHHLEGAMPATDAARDAHLNFLGFCVLRFSNGDVAQHLDGVMHNVLAALGAVMLQE